MKPRTFLQVILAAILVPLLSAAAYAAPAEDVYLLGIALDQEGAAGGWAQVGPAGAWKGTVAGTVLDGRLYTVEASGALYVTNLGSGQWQQLGKAEFGDTKFMFAAGEKLYTIENNGTLYRVNPDDGGWVPLGPVGAWKGTVAGAVLDGRLYTVERAGGLWATDLGTGKWQAVGKPEFGKTKHLLAAGNRLYSIEGDGSLFRIDPADGSWAAVGPAGGWKSTVAGTVMNNQLYTVESNGGLWFTNVRTGDWKEIGKAEFGDTRFMFPAGGFVYTIEGSGSLYRVAVKSGPTVDSYNWCPEEIEKLFREQGKSFYKTLHAKQILGAKATHAAAMDGLGWLRQNAGANDLAVVYVGAHGGTDPTKGWSISTADGAALWGSEVKAELAKLRCPALVLIETCGSGGFGQRHPEDPPVPANVTVLCACSTTETTNNQLDLAVAEALYGRGDFDGNGTVDVDELSQYVERRYKEWWPDPKAEGSETPVIVRSAALAGSRPLTKASPALAAVAWQGELWSALVERQGGDRYHVHFLGWSSRPGEPYFLTDVVGRDAVCLPADGPPLLVRQGDHWQPARLAGRDGAKYSVHYLGKNQDDVVAGDRVRFPFAGQAGGRK